VFYCVRDPLIVKVLDGMRQYFYAHLSEAVEMLEEVETSR
jgi:ArsR family transcriptional regulator